MKELVGRNAPGGICSLERMHRSHGTDLVPGFLIITFIGLLLFPLLYIFRFHDDNTLTGWQWVFNNVSLGKMYFLAFLGLALSGALSRVHVPGRFYPCVLAALSFLAVCPVWTEPEVVLDTSRYVVQAKYLELYGPWRFLQEWGNGIDPWTDLPLVSFLHGMIFRYAGETRTFIQIVHTVLFSLTVYITFLLGKEIRDEENGFFAGLMLLAMPYLLVQVPLMLVDVPAMFFVTLSFYTAARAVRRGGTAMLVVASLSVFLALMSKYTVWGMFLGLPSLLLVCRRDDLPAGVLRLSAVMTIALMLLSLSVALYYEVFRKQMLLLWTYQLPALGGWSESWVSTFIFQSHPALLLFALAGAYIALKERDGRVLIAGWFFLFIVLFRAHRIRYILPLFPLFTIMGARGLRFLVPEGLRKYTVYGMISLSLIVLYAGYVPFLERTSMSNLQKAGAYLDEAGVPAAEVIPLPQTASSGNTAIALPILDLYTDTRLVYKENTIPLPSGSKRALMPLRFTWEYRYRDLYARESNGPAPVILVSGTLPDMTSLRNISRSSPAAADPQIAFMSSTGVFRYRTYVTVYQE